MPGLTNSSKITVRRGKGRNVRRRARIIGSLLSESFSNGDVSNWTASTGATVSNGLSNDHLLIATGSGAGGAYGYREISCEPNVTLNFSIVCDVAGLGASSKIWIGTSAGDYTHKEQNCSDDDTYTFSFTPTGSSFFISLSTTNARSNTKWTNLVITEA